MTESICTIKTWRERMKPQWAVPRPPEHAVYAAMESEIRELRKALASTYDKLNKGGVNGQTTGN